jgi:hypothetical protein
MRRKSKNRYREKIALRPEDIVEIQEKIDEYELQKTNVSDLNDPGDPEAGDVGLPGGAGSGGEMGEGGSGGIEKEHDDENDLKPFDERFSTTGLAEEAITPEDFAEDTISDSPSENKTKQEKHWK